MNPSETPGAAVMPRDGGVARPAVAVVAEGSEILALHAKLRHHGLGARLWGHAGATTDRKTGSEPDPRGHQGGGVHPHFTIVRVAPTVTDRPSMAPSVWNSR